MADLYPVFIDLENKPCLVVGGGRVALRKIEALLGAGAEVTVVDPHPDPELCSMAGAGKLVLSERPFESGLVCGMWLVFCATDDKEVNRSVYEACEKMRIPANVADDPALCRFHVPARYTEGLLQAAVSTRGGSPAFSRHLRIELEKRFSPWAPLLVEWLNALRPRLKEIVPDDAKQRGEFLKKLIEHNGKKIEAFAREGDVKSFDKLVAAELRKITKG